MSKDAFLEPLASHPQVDQLVVSEKPTSAKVLLQLTLSYLLMIAVWASTLWFWRLRRELCAILQDFLVSMFPLNLYPKLKWAYQRRIDCCLLLCLLPMMVVIGRMLLWLV